MERIVARDSGVTTRARRSGVITDVDSKRIVLQATETTVSRGDVGVPGQPSSAALINQRILIGVLGSASVMLLGLVISLQMVLLLNMVSWLCNPSLLSCHGKVQL